MMQEFDHLDETLKHAKKKALYLLEKQDRTEAQLRQKLEEQDYPASVVEQALSYVKSFHYIDDLRFAQNYIRYRQNQKSRQQLKFDLRKKGVAPETIEIALEEEFSSDERQMIMKLLEKKKYHEESADAKEKHRVMAYLMRRGFSYDDIQSCMRNT